MQCTLFDRFRAFSAGIAPNVIHDASRTSTDAGTDRNTIFRKMTIVRDYGFTNFTAGIRSGWHAEISSRKFKQVRLCRAADGCVARTTPHGDACVREITDA